MRHFLLLLLVLSSLVVIWIYFEPLLENFINFIINQFLKILGINIDVMNVNKTPVFLLSYIQILKYTILVIMCMKIIVICIVIYIILYIVEIWDKFLKFILKIWQLFLKLICKIWQFFRFLFLLLLFLYLLAIIINYLTPILYMITYIVIKFYIIKPLTFLKIFTINKTMKQYIFFTIYAITSAILQAICMIITHICMTKYIKIFENDIYVKILKNEEEEDEFNDNRKYNNQTKNNNTVTNIIFNSIKSIIFGFFKFIIIYICGCIILSICWIIYINIFKKNKTDSNETETGNNGDKNNDDIFYSTNDELDSNILHFISFITFIIALTYAHKYMRVSKKKDKSLKKNDKKNNKGGKK